MKNLFIVLDGMDGCGKSTHLGRLHNYLFEKDKKNRILSTREPTYGTSGKKIREILTKQTDPLEDADLLLDLYVKDRAEHVEWVIDPFLSYTDGNRHIILCDRYYYSTIAYQSAQGIDVKKALKGSDSFPVPDLTLILETDPEDALSRIHSERSKEKFEELSFMKTLKENFRNLPNLLKDTIVFIDTSGSQEETFAKIKAEVDKIL